MENVISRSLKEKTTSKTKRQGNYRQYTRIGLVDAWTGGL